MAKSGSHLVIVESPTKAKTIKKFLPKDFVVQASMGHIRDLPQSAADIPKDLKKEDWAKLGVNCENDFEPLYIVPKGKSKIVRELKKLIKDADTLYLATDEDREGESISWHLLELLNPKIPVKRMVFHEITKKAIQDSLEHVRDVDLKLVRAQETRRILDRLYGYTLSPLLWKKIAYGLSAGRVQSSGLKMIVERERERMTFVKADYCSIKAELAKSGDKSFEARLSNVGEKKVAIGKDFSAETGKLDETKKDKIFLIDEKAAKDILEKLKKGKFEVISVDEKESFLNPSVPFITSTLQQEGNRKLGMSARETMRVAQKLYEQGFITYMRTDSPNLSTEAIQAARNCIEDLYGKEYLSAEPRQYKAKGKGAQEAHEAIRPAGNEFVHPDQTGLIGKEKSLYDLIWKRTMATQMERAKKATMTVKVKNGEYLFTANGSRIIFPGFLRAYVEGSDDPESALDNKEVILPELQSKDTLDSKKLEKNNHETKPPARYTEASLVQRLEKEGIGRPSTYATIIGTVQERGYVRKEGTALVPTFTGIAVVQFLEDYFSNLVDYSFTSDMEQKLDEIAEGNEDWLKYLQNFYLGTGGLKKKVENQEKKIKPDDSRTVRLPQLKDIIDVKVGRYGPYIIAKPNKGDEVHASIPEEIAPADLKAEDIDELIELSKKGPEPLGKDPATGEDIYCLIGRYGAYLQLGEKTDDNPKPKRASLSAPWNPKNITLEAAIKLLELPRDLGVHPETGKEIKANVGRFGPYVMHDGDFRSLKKDDNVYTITLKRALEILDEPKVSSRGAKIYKEFDRHPDTNKKIAIYDGKYGLFIKYGTKNIGIPEALRKSEIIDKWKLKDVVEVINKSGKK
ncbi:MAG: type I DNA topoisomerase [Halobacteriovoraceae bacterium]|nr:type I DNA topoisomerase [Halobacteriovoraceae bacterium]